MWMIWTGVACLGMYLLGWAMAGGGHPVWLILGAILIAAGGIVRGLRPRVNDVDTDARLGR